MRAPHPALRGLYRQASTPARLSAHLRSSETLLDRFAVELIAGGRDGEVLFDALLGGVQLEALLRGPLARLTGVAAAVEPAPPAMSPPQWPLEAGTTPDRWTMQSQSAAASSESLLGQIDRQQSAATPRAASLPAWPAQERFAPEAQPQLAKLLRERAETVACPGVNAPAAFLSPGLPDAASAYRQLDERMTRHGVMTAFHQSVAPQAAEQKISAMLERAATVGQASARPHLAGQVPQRIAALLEQIERATNTAGKRALHIDDSGAAGARPVPENSSTKRADRTVASPHTPLATRSEASAASPAARAAERDRPGNTLLEAPVSGLRGLIAVAQTSAAAATPPPLPAEAPGPGAFDNTELSASISALLRREALRYGIDITGTK